MFTRHVAQTEFRPASHHGCAKHITHCATTRPVFAFRSQQDHLLCHDRKLMRPTHAAWALLLNRDVKSSAVGKKYVRSLHQLLVSAEVHSSPSVGTSPITHGFHDNYPTAYGQPRHRPWD